MLHCFEVCSILFASLGPISVAYFLKVLAVEIELVIGSMSMKKTKITSLLAFTASYDFLKFSSIFFDFLYNYEIRVVASLKVH